MLFRSWWWNFRHREEYARGFDSVEDLHCLGAISVELKPGQSVTLGASLAVDAPVTAARLATRRPSATVLSPPPDSPSGPTGDGERFIDALRHAAASFLVRREETDGDGSDPAASGWTVLAGYHWFGDWGRDTDRKSTRLNSSH